MNPLKVDHQDLKHAFQNDFQDHERQPSCIAPDHIWDAVAGKTQADQTLKMVNHTATCPSCAEHWRIAQELYREQASTIETCLPMPKRGLWPTLTLAVAAVAILAFFFTFSSKTSEHTMAEAPLRAGPLPTIASLLPKDISLSREACVLQWSLSVDAEQVQYRLRVTTADPFEVVVDVKLTESQYQIPLAKLKRLPSQTPLLWRVTATLPDQTQTHSPTFTHLIR